MFLAGLSFTLSQQLRYVKIQILISWNHDILRASRSLYTNFLSVTLDQLRARPLLPSLPIFNPNTSPSR